MKDLTIGQIAAIGGPSAQTYRNWLHRKPLRLNETDPGGKWRRFGFADQVRLLALGRLARLGMDADAIVAILNEHFEFIEDAAERATDKARRQALRDDRPIIVANTGGQSHAFVRFGEYLDRLAHRRCEPAELVIDVYELVNAARVAATSDATHDPGAIIE